MLGLDTPEKYLIYLIRQYVLRTIKGINMTQEQFENKITGMKADTSRYFSELQLEETENLMRKFYIFVSNPEVNKKIKNGEVTEKDLIDLFTKNYQEVDQSQYNENLYHNPESEELSISLDILRDKNIISKDVDGKKKLRFVDIPDAPIHEFLDDGKNVTIQEVGRIIYTYSINRENDISKYKIVIINNNEIVTEIEVYSNLKLANMSDENYKRVVLKYLLGKFNLQNLNYKGYIGEIEKRDNYDNERNHKIVNGELTHIIDDSYVLRYKSEDLSAVSEYEDSKDNINSKQATVKDFRNLQNTKKLKGEAR